MINRKGSTTVTAIASIAAALGVGVAGYMLMNGECGSCALTGDSASAALVSSAGEKDGGCCPLTEGEEVTLVASTTDASCCGSSCDGDATLVAAKGDCESTCSGDAELVAAKGDCESTCSGGAELVADKGECEGKVCPITGQPVVQQVALEAEGECEKSCTDKTDCEKECPLLAEGEESNDDGNG